MMNRRSLLRGLIAAPLVVRESGILMPVKKIIEPVWMGWDLGSGSSIYRFTVTFARYSDATKIRWEEMPISEVAYAA